MVGWCVLMWEWDVRGFFFYRGCFCLVVFIECGGCFFGWFVVVFFGIDGVVIWCGLDFR